MADTASKPTGKKKKRKSKISKGFIAAFILVVCLPVGGLLVWYFTTAALSVSGSKLTASQMVAANLAKVKQAMRSELVERAELEKFSIKYVDQCRGTQKLYRIPSGIKMTKQLGFKLIGLPSNSSREDVLERCILYAKIVKRMEKLAHHERHVFMCENSEFTADESGRFKILADPKGRGLIESMSGKERLIPIKRGTHKLIRQIQVFNLGDGCIIVGGSSRGTFSLNM